MAIAVGDHVRLPRTYRGRDIHRWMQALGLLDERDTEVEDLAWARRLPSAQLVGTPERRSLGLPELRAAGVRLVGRLVGGDEQRSQFSGSLANLLRSADLKQAGSSTASTPTSPPTVSTVPLPSPTAPNRPRSRPGLNTLAWGEFETVVWATGYRPYYPWLEPGLLDRRGQLAHGGGATRQPGLYVLGLPFLRRRSSSFICGLEHDVAELADHVVGHLGQAARAA